MWKVAVFVLALTALACAQPAAKKSAQYPSKSYNPKSAPVYHGYHYGGYHGYPYGFHGFPFGFPYNYYGYPYNYHPKAAVPERPHPKAPVYSPPVHSAELKYMGEFDGTCEGKADGLYYVDERSFAFCSGSIKTIQACAEGSINPAHNDFSSGKYQHFYDFCSINLAAKDHKY